MNDKKKLVMNAMMMSELNKMIASGEVDTTCGECGKNTVQKDIIGLRQRDGKLSVICNDHYDTLGESCNIE